MGRKIFPFFPLGSYGFAHDSFNPIQSGFSLVYMSVSMYEDKCSQAFRTADHIADFDNHEMLLALEQCQSWEAKTVIESDTLQRIIKSLDLNCVQRMESMNEYQLLRTGFLVGMILPKMRHCKTLNHLVVAHQILGTLAINIFLPLSSC